MTFSSPVFLFLFFPLVILCYFLIPARLLRLRNAFLTAASLLFYGFGEPAAMLLMLCVVGWSWGAALLLQKCPKQGRLFLLLGIAGDIGVLCIYKYTNFIIDTLNTCLGLSIGHAELRLPIGISFFVFQAVSYIMDVSRGESQAQRNYFRLLLYIAFFPQLIAGPIVRYQTIEEELTRRHASLSDITEGVRGLILGLSKKLLLADTVGFAADTVFGASAETGLPAAWLGAVCYTLQIYFDFSGYSDMAVGMGRIFGFHFPENFRLPYSAATITEFWRRWHISLTTWFRQYLYIPLGGNRKGRARTVLNKWAVFLCTGLWHGASWNFVLWGILNGALMTAEQLTGLSKTKKRSWYLHLYTVLAVVLAFVMFRAETVPQALEMYHAMFSPAGMNRAALAAGVQLLSPLLLTVLAVSCVLAVWSPAKLLETARQHAPFCTELAVNAVCLGLLALCMMNAAAETYHPFIYFRF